MKRRDFIINSLKLGGILCSGLGISQIAEILMNLEHKASASEAMLYSAGLPIVQNYFSFTDLVQRQITNKIIVHHSAIERDITAADVHRIHQQNGWAGIGYHMFIHANGLIETGRPLSCMGAHTYGYNEDSIGICLNGNFDIQEPTQLQIESAEKLIGVLCNIYNLTPNNVTIFGHRDFNATKCPGDNLYSQLDTIRSLAAKNM